MPALCLDLAHWTPILTYLDIWSQVILHTYIDSLRVDENREINHHGSSVKVTKLKKNMKRESFLH